MVVSVVLTGSAMGGAAWDALSCVVVVLVYDGDNVTGRLLDSPVVRHSGAANGVANVVVTWRVVPCGVAPENASCDAPEPVPAPAPEPVPVPAPVPAPAPEPEPEPLEP